MRKHNFSLFNTSVLKCGLMSLIVGSGSLFAQTPVNDPPVINSALPIRVDMFIGEVASITIDATDDEVIHINQPTNFLSGTSLSLPTPDNSLTFTYTPTETTSMVDTFQVKVCEVVETSNCTNVNVIVTITDTAKAPIAVDDFKTIKEGAVAEV